MRYDWDETKRQANRAKHGVDFPAMANFDWESAQVEPDTRKDYGESRYIAAGYIDKRLHIVVFAQRGEAIRLVGLRKANPREVKKYAQKTQTDQPTGVG